MDCSNGSKPMESLKKYLSKEGLLKNDPTLSRMMYSKFAINGVLYCRPHLLLHCHLCEENSSACLDDINSERERLCLRYGGDARLNKRAEEWSDRLMSMQFAAMVKVKSIGIPFSLRAGMMFGEMKSSESAVNQEFLADVAQVFKDGTSQCCYWGCEQPDAEKLSKCSGCGVVKYCSKKHQALDWKWEHKFECTKSVPKLFLDEIEADRQRNLHGDYQNINRYSS